MDPRVEIQTCESLLLNLKSWIGDGALTQNERERAQGIDSPARRDQFLAGRWLAKTMLAEALGGSPCEWRISTDPGCKPQVLGHAVHLSIAHTGDFVACSVAGDLVGIDVERLNRRRPIADMADLVCSAVEQRALRDVPQDVAMLRFIQMWTCKEARLKQWGRPFDVAELRAIQTTPADSQSATVGTWCFAQQSLMLSVAAEELSALQPRWPADWVASPVQWHRYV